jgi:molybdopterin molybdotransferase
VTRSFDPAKRWGTGQVFDSNHYLLSALLDSVGCEVIDAGIAPDEAPAVREKLLALAAENNALLTTGGASRGEEDHLVTSLDSVGKRHLWQLAVKPGRPMSFGQIGDCPVVALPGNPVAAFVCFLLYVRPMLIVMGGGAWREPQRFSVPPTSTSLPVKPAAGSSCAVASGRIPEGRQMVTKFDRDGSGLITSLREADGLIEISEEISFGQPRRRGIVSAVFRPGPLRVGTTQPDTLSPSAPGT